MVNSLHEMMRTSEGSWVAGAGTGKRPEGGMTPSENLKDPLCKILCVSHTFFAGVTATKEAYLMFVLYIRKSLSTLTLEALHPLHQNTRTKERPRPKTVVL